MRAHIIPSKREAYAEFLKNLAADGQPQTAEVLATLLYDADRVASLVEQVARLTQQVDALELECDNLRTLATARADGDMMAGVEPEPSCGKCKGSGFAFYMDEIGDGYVDACDRCEAGRLAYQQMRTSDRNRSLPVAS
jgi:predicted Zn-ribbon and HTH transcriptional regulator